MNNVEFERIDSLEGWVAIKTNLFEEKETYKLGFIVQWNVIESKFAVTCHNRTLQRQKRKDEVVFEDTPTSWAGLFSVNDLRSIHHQLTSVADVLGHYFPDLSGFEEGNVWDLIFPSRSSGLDAGLEDFDTSCRRLEKYFSTAIDVCSRKIVLDSLFSEDERDVDEYFENLQEFKKRALQEEVSRAKVHLRRLLQTHGERDRMVLLLSIYEEEDQAYHELVTVATTFFQYLLQPFRDMRELACLYKMEILKSLDFEELGPKRISALEKEAEEWRRRAEDAVSSIQDITVSYFVQTSKALADMLKQMEEDKCRFGPAAWASAAPRLEQLRFLLAKETLQYMRATEMCLNRKKDSIRERLEGLDKDCGPLSKSASGSGQQQKAVDQLELQFYEAQLELYDTKFEILKNEEQLLVAQIDTLRRQIKELKEEVVYYDVCEDPEELRSLVHTGLQQPGTAAVNQLKRRLQALETKRGRICARRAYLRNKKDQCMEAHEQKQHTAEQSSMAFQQHHQVHLRREKKKEEEQRTKEWVDQEREKTLSRLRSFREKRHGQYVLKTPRPKMTSPMELACSDPSQPLSICCLDLPPPSFGVPTPTQRRTPKKRQPPKPQDIPVQIYAPPPPPMANLANTALPPPPLLPPPPPPPPLPPTFPPPPLTAPPPSHDTPMPLSEKETAPFPARNTLKDNIGTMDEVLASLQRGQIQLRKAPGPRAPGTAPSEGDQRNNLMLAIRKGVTLKKVSLMRPEAQPSSGNELERSIKAAMQRMKKVSANSDDEDGDDQTQSTEWDS